MKFLFAAAVLFMSSLVMAETNVETKCAEILTGKTSVALKNEIRRHGETVSKSPAFQEYCPNIDFLDAKQKEDAIVHFFAAYSYYQVACRPTGRGKLAGEEVDAKEYGAKVIDQTNVPGEKIEFGGLFWQPLNRAVRKKLFSGTPCDYAEPNDLNQVSCAVYGLTSEAPASGSTFHTIQGMLRVTRNKIKREMGKSMPSCFPAKTEVNGDVETASKTKATQ